MKTFRINLENEFEAEVFDNILKEDNIPHAIISNHSSVYDGIFEITMGWGFVEIPKEFKDKAIKLYNDYKESEENIVDD